MRPIPIRNEANFSNPVSIRFVSLLRIQASMCLLDFKKDLDYHPPARRAGKSRTHVSNSAYAQRRPQSRIVEKQWPTTPTSTPQRASLANINVKQSLAPPFPEPPYHKQHETSGFDKGKRSNNAATFGRDNQDTTKIEAAHSQPEPAARTANIANDSLLQYIEVEFCSSSTSSAGSHGKTSLPSREVRKNSDLGNVPAKQAADVRPGNSLRAERIATGRYAGQRSPKNAMANKGTQDSSSVTRREYRYW